MRKECPCRGCEDRKLLCHSSCRLYQEWKADFEAMKEGKPDYDATWSERSKRRAWRNMRFSQRKYRP
jgi:hypothetical protein